MSLTTIWISDSGDRLPIFELFRQAMRSDTAATAFVVFMFVGAVVAVIGCQQVTWIIQYFASRSMANMGTDVYATLPPDRFASYVVLR